MNDPCPKPKPTYDAQWQANNPRDYRANLPEEESQELDALVRDACTIGYYGPKSEYRKRLQTLITKSQIALLETARDQHSATCKARTKDVVDCVWDQVIYTTLTELKGKL